MQISNSYAKQNNVIDISHSSINPRPFLNIRQLELHVENTQKY